MFKFFNNTNLLNTNYELTKVEFNFIINFCNNLTLSQLYKYFKTLEKSLNLKHMCLTFFKKLDKFEQLNIKLIKFFFLIHCIQCIKKKNLINLIFNCSNLKFNFSPFINSKLFTNFYLEENKKNKINKNLINFYLVSEVYKYYKGSIVPFNISNLSWFVRTGLKQEVNLFVIILAVLNILNLILLKMFFSIII
jgi:hypothetical protein